MQGDGEIGDRRPISRARHASAIISEAPAPVMATPRTRPEDLSWMSLVTPSVRPMPAARPEAPQGILTMPTSRAVGLGLLLGDAAPGDLGIRMDDHRIYRRVEGGVASGDDLAAHATLVNGPIREQRGAGDVADRVDAGIGRAHLIVDGDETRVVELNAGLVEFEFVDICDAPQAYDRGFEGTGGRGGRAGELHVNRVVLHVGVLDGALEVPARESSLEGFLHGPHDVCIRFGQETLALIHECHCRPQGGVDGRDLNRHVIRPDHEQRLGTDATRTAVSGVNTRSPSNASAGCATALDPVAISTRRSHARATRWPSCRIARASSTPGGV